MVERSTVGFMVLGGAVEVAKMASKMVITPLNVGV